ncbi:MAG: metal-dependent hydrolase [candidate division Zixibacteria bacterium]|nr:metal-dependent hydrolase [candidate division Zixibacteria bacterium]
MLKLTFIGHSCFLLDDGKYKVVIDPFITGNPMAKISADDLKVDFILVTHGHGDHFGDAINLAKKNNAAVISNFELASYCESKGVKNTAGLHIGGGAEFPFGSVKLTIAHHGSTLGADMGYGGNPVGFIIRMAGKVVYHAGDTGLFLDMKLIGEMDKIDMALLPIGGYFTMDANDAAKAVEFLNPKKAIPMHYNTFPPVKADPNVFADKIKQYGVECIILQPDQSYDIE